MAEQKVAWQENKSLHERNRYMLENEIACDVSFEICLPEGSTAGVVVRAHKAFLVAASPVFEAMFCGGMVEARLDSGSVKIPDIDEQTFKEMLRHIYYEKADITAGTALPLMYAAKKYLLTGLVAECVTILEKELSVDTVCTLLEQSMSLGENELKKKSLHFISRNMHRVLKTDEFLHISHDALEEIVSLEFLVYSSERLLYENCMKWARQQLRETGNEFPSDEEIRNKLGSVLYKIRFPTMPLEDFAELTAQSAVLTAEEKHDVYVYIALANQLETLKFGTQRRQMEDAVGLSRFNKTFHGQWNCDGQTDAISIQTTVDIVLTGVGLYGGMEASTHDITLKVCNGNDVLSKVETKMVSNGSQNPIKIELQNSVCVHANTMYTVAALIKGPKTWAGEGGKSACEFRDGRITFHPSEVSQNGTNMDRGQIPQLFYYTEKQ